MQIHALTILEINMPTEKVVSIQMEMDTLIQTIHGIQEMVLTPSRTMILNGLISMKMDLVITGVIVLGPTDQKIGQVCL